MIAAIQLERVPHRPHRKPKAGARKMKTRRQDADDGDAPLRQHHLLSDNPRILAEVIGPHFIGDHRHRRTVALVIVGYEIATQHRAYPQGLKYVPACIRRGKYFISLRTLEGDRTVRIVNRHRLEAGRAALPILIVRIRNVVTARPFDFGEFHQPVRIVESQWPQQYSVYNAEDRRVHTDAERDCDDRQGGEAGIAPERPRSETKVQKHAATIAIERPTKTKTLLGNPAPDRPIPG